MRIRRDVGVASVIALILMATGCSEGDSALDIDTDGDGVIDLIDAFPDDPSESFDNDADGVGDNADNCLGVANADQADADADGFGDACDFTVISENLLSPRGIGCGADDSILVALAGAGPNLAATGEALINSESSYVGADGRVVQYGETGSVISIASDFTSTIIMNNLPSVAVQSEQDPSVWTDATGPADVVRADDGGLIVAIGLAGDACLSRPDLTAPDAVLLGTVIDEQRSIIADIADFECSNNVDSRLAPSGTAPDHTSNPFRLLNDYPDTGSLTVLDAGMNALIEVDSTGERSTLVADFPDQQQEMPDLGLVDIIGVDQTVIGLPPAGAVIPSQPVPSGISKSPVGDTVLVSELTGLPFAIGSARTYDVTDGTAVVDQDGFTTIVDIAHDASGDVFVLEYATNGLPGLLGFGPSNGRLSKQSLGSEVRDFSDKVQLSTPTAVEVCGSNIYVSDQGSVAGQGRILRGDLNAL